jgi:hypothetical protein
VPTINNILNLRINNVSSSSSVNLGSTINLSPQTNSKTVGDSVAPVGDLANVQPFIAGTNTGIDPDVIDQSEKESGLL